MTSFVVKEMASDVVVRKLLDERIIVKEAVEGGTACIRVSPQYWNTERELDRLVSVLSKVTGVDKAAWAAPPV